MGHFQKENQVLLGPQPRSLSLAGSQVRDNMKEWVVIRSLDFVMNFKLHHSYLDETGG